MLDNDKIKELHNALDEIKNKLFESTGAHFKTDSLSTSKICFELDKILTPSGSLFDLLIENSKDVKKYVLLNISEIKRICEIGMDKEFKAEETAIIAVIFRAYFALFSI